MIFRRWSPADSLAPGHASVGQPLPEAPAVVPDAIIAPLLAFDRRLNRLGPGGGHYDRTSARYRHALRIGLAWSAQARENGRAPVVTPVNNAQLVYRLLLEKKKK